MEIALFSLMGLAGLLEVVGGVLILVGLFTRPVAFVLSGFMAVAYFMAHAPQSFYPALNEGDAAVLFCFIYLYLVFAGPGAWSVDALRARAPAAQSASAGRAARLSFFTAPRSLLRLEPPLLRGRGRPCRPARLRRFGGAADQRHQPLQRVGAVALLRAVAVGEDHDDAVLGEPRAGEPLQPHAARGREATASGARRSEAARRSRPC